MLAALTAAALLIGCGKKDTAPAAGDASTPAAEVSNKIVVGLDDNSPPMGFRDQKNELTGFDIELAQAAAKHLGMGVGFKPIDWSAKEAELNGKRVDVLWNGLTITEKRKENLSFTKPYLENRQIIIVAAKFPVKTKADLAGKVVGLQDGSTAYDAVEKDPTALKSFKELKKYSDNVAALMDVNAGRLDALVVDEVVGRYYTAKKPGKYVILEDNFGTEEYGVGVRKDNKALLEKLQKALDEMDKDGTAAKISTKWFGKDIVKR